MTREDVVRLIEERHQKGYLTKDDLYDIGMSHRQLPKKDRSWSWLLSLTGGFTSSEAYRNFVLKKVRKEGLLTYKSKTQEDNLKELKQDVQKERIKLRDERTTLNAMLRESARSDILKEIVEKSIKDIKPLKILTSAFNYDNVNILERPAEGILLLSDWHIGQDCDNFYNKFNIEIAERRINRIIDNAISYCITLGITKLHVLNLGDLIEGKINNTGRIESNERTLKQLMIATEFMANALNKLQAHVPFVTYRSVTDNHSNITSTFKDRIPEESLNIITTWYLKARLVNSKIHFIDDNLDYGLGRFELDNGMKVAFFHGHEDSKDKTLQNIVGATHDWTDIVCGGHWHNPAEHVYQDMRFFINGSLCGTGPYALSHRMFNKPSQKLIVVDKHNFLNLDISAD